MQKKILFIGCILVMTCTLKNKEQYVETNSTYNRWFYGSPLHLLGNFDTLNSPNFAQLHSGYRITGKNGITLEPYTYKNAWPNFKGIFGSTAY